MPGVRVHVLGTTQDGGVPHAGCSCTRCHVARADVEHRRHVTSIAIEGETGRALLVDATPDFCDQLAILAKSTGRKLPGIDAIVITHAHMGHYLGLAFLGKEAIQTDKLPVYGTPSFGRFLRGNRPWCHLIQRGEIDLRTIIPGSPLPFDGAVLHAFLTPHRGEDTDTIGFEILGPRKHLIYVSDADVLPEGIIERIRRADIAIVDGTFYSRSELPHRDIVEVRHPYIPETIALIGATRGEVYFTHMNHTNPILDPASHEARSLPKQFHVLQEGIIFAI